MSGKIEISRDLAERLLNFTCNEEYDELRKILAAPVVERQPVAWEVYWSDNGEYYFTTRKKERSDKLAADPDFKIVPLYTSPPAPVAVELLARIQSEGLLCYAPEIDAEVTACLEKVKEMNQ